jgi:hypothetical protein
MIMRLIPVVLFSFALACGGGKHMPPLGVSQ